MKFPLFGATANNGAEMPRSYASMMSQPNRGLYKPQAQTSLTQLPPNHFNMRKNFPN